MKRLAALWVLGWVPPLQAPLVAQDSAGLAPLTELQLALAREQWVRSFALTEEPECSAWSERSRSANWEDRWDALDAAWRRMRVGNDLPSVLLERVCELCQDPQPNVRALAWRLQAGAGVGCSLPEPGQAIGGPELTEAELVLYILPCLRQTQSCSPAGLVAAAKAGDGALARALLAAGGRPFAEAQMDWLCANSAELDARALVEAWPRLLARGVDPSLLQALRKAALHSTAGVRSLVEWFTLQAGRRQGAPTLGYDPEVCAAGWLDAQLPRMERDLAYETARAALLRNLPAQYVPELAQALLVRGLELATWERRGWWLWPRIFEALGVGQWAWPAPFAWLGYRRSLLCERTWPCGGEDAELPQVALARQALANFARPLDGVQVLLQAAADLVPEQQVLAWAAAAQPREAALLWQSLADRVGDFSALDLEPWIAASIDAALGVRVAEVLARQYGRDPTPKLRAKLAQLLPRCQPRQLELLFRALAQAPHPPYEDMLTAWLALPIEQRMERLRDLPRGQAIEAFREVLLQLAALPESRSSSVLELLAAFRQDREVASALQGWLQQCLEAGLHSNGNRESESWTWQARGLMDALREVDASTHAVDFERSARLLAQVWGESGPGARELAKAALLALGRSRAGLEFLANWLDPDVPRRLRIEASLQLLQQGGQEPIREEPARQWLLHDWEYCDSELRERVLTAFGRLSDAASGQWLESCVVQASLPPELSLAALRALGERGERQRLLRLWPAALPLELRLALIDEFSQFDGEEARQHLRLLAEHFRAGFLQQGPDSTDGQIAGALHVALARRGLLNAEELTLLWARPLQWAASDLAARCQERGLPEVHFRWRSELELAEHMARSGQLAEALVLQARWWNVDGRYLAAMAELVARSALAELDEGTQVSAQVRTAQRLIAAALVALDGEPARNESALLRAQLSLRALVLAEWVGDWPRALFWSEQLYWELLLGGNAGHALERVMGGYDERNGRDPAARLAAAAEQARAGLCWARGDRLGAEHHRLRARALVGHSQEAQVAQERLEQRYLR